MHRINIQEVGINFVIPWGRYYRRPLRLSRNTPEQLVVLKYPNFRLKFSNVASLEYFS